MARHPDWFERLDAILDVVRQAERIEWFGRSEIKAVFHSSERDSIRLLHKFGAVERENILSLPGSALLAQLEAIRGGTAYGAFLRQRENTAEKLAAARAETVARHFRVRTRPSDRLPALDDLPKTISWRRTDPGRPGRFEIVYTDGADLLSQIAEFLSAAGVHRTEFVAATEPGEGA